MIDTLWLQVEVFQILPHCQLNLDLPVMDCRTGEVVAGDTEWNLPNGVMRGKRIRFRNEKIHVQMNRLRSGQQGIKIQLCATKWHDRKRWQPLKRAEFEQVVKEVEEYLYNVVGIATNIRLARVVRLDVFRYILTDFPFETYHNVRLNWSPYRMHWHCQQGWHLWENGEHQICNYNKRNDIKRFDPECTCPEKLEKCEYRALNAKKVKAIFDVEIVDQLLEQFDALPVILLKQIKSLLFRRKVEASAQPLLLGIADQVRQFQQRGHRYPMQSFREMCSAIHLTEKFGEEAVRAMFGEVASSSKTANEWLKNYQASLRDAEEIGAFGCLNLQSELHEKLLAPIGPCEVSHATTRENAVAQAC